MRAKQREITVYYYKLNQCVNNYCKIAINVDTKISPEKVKGRFKKIMFCSSFSNKIRNK